MWGQHIVNGQMRIEAKAEIGTAVADTYRVELKLHFTNLCADTLYQYFFTTQDWYPQIRPEPHAGMKTIDYTLRLAASAARRRYGVGLDGHNISSIGNNGHILDGLFVLKLPPGEDVWLNVPQIFVGRKFLKFRKFKLNIQQAYYDGMPEVVEHLYRWARANDLQYIYTVHHYELDLVIHSRHWELTKVGCMVHDGEPRELGNGYQEICALQYNLRKWEGFSDWRDTIGKWDLKLEAKKGIRFQGSLSPSQAFGLPVDAHASPFFVCFEFIPHLNDAQIQERIRENAQLEKQVTAAMRKQEGKTHWLNSKDTTLQRQILAQYALVPTHRFDENWDMVVYDSRPTGFEAPLETEPVTQQYKALLEFIASKYEPLGDPNDLPYLGVVGRNFCAVGSKK